jgi:diacylglycerol O-acyltransferase 2, plant
MSNICDIIALFVICDVHCPLSAQLTLFEHVFCYLFLFLLCGFYYVLLVLLPLLLYLCIVQRSVVAAIIFATLIFLTVIPLNHTPWEAFMYAPFWTTLRKYFDVTYDASSVHGKLNKAKPCMFFEFPHGVFPVGQLLSASLIKEVFGDQMICGTGADVVFKIPLMRQLFAWLGTVPASGSNIKKVLKRGDHCAIIPGGIAEMYLVSRTEEAVYLKKRANTIRVAIREGADIVPVFFFGNSSLFDIVGGAGGADGSFLAKMSRKLRASIILFYGRHFLPVPYRKPIRMVSADIVTVRQNDNPTAEEIEEVMQRLVASLEKLWKEKRPTWEKRPLVIR